MQLQYSVTVEVDPDAITGRPEQVVRYEIASNLESVDYVLRSSVDPLTASQHVLPVRDQPLRSTAMPGNDTEHTTDAETRAKGKAHRLPQHGNVHPTVFENHGAKGTFYTVDVQRAYLEGETRSRSISSLLQLGSFSRSVPHGHIFA